MTDQRLKKLTEGNMINSNKNNELQNQNNQDERIEQEQNTTHHQSKDYNHFTNYSQGSVHPQNVNYNHGAIHQPSTNYSQETMHQQNTNYNQNPAHNQYVGYYQNQKKRMKNSTKAIIAGSIIIGIILMIVATVFLVNVFFSSLTEFSSMINDHPSNQIAREYIKSNSELEGFIGEVIDFGPMRSGNISTSGGGRGSAHFVKRVIGTDGDAYATISLSRRGSDNWEVIYFSFLLVP